MMFCVFPFLWKDGKFCFFCFKTINGFIFLFYFLKKEVILENDKINHTLKSFPIKDELELVNIRDCIENNKPVVLKNITKGEKYNLDSSHLSERQRAMLLCGGLLDYTREMNK